MRFEVEVFGVVLRVTVGPEVTEYEYVATPERLHAVDVSPAGYAEDPVFPDLDWGEDRAGTGERALDLGRGRERGSDLRGDIRGPFGFGR